MERQPLSESRILNPANQEQASMASILIVDNGLTLNNFLQAQINKLGYEAATADSLEQGIAKADEDYYDVVFLDASAMQGNLFETIHKFKSQDYSPEVVILTPDGNPEEAEQAIKAGAWDYIASSISSKSDLDSLISSILEFRCSNKMSSPGKEIIRNGIIGNSRQLLHCLDSLSQVAMGSQNVLITGETGTGKELFARAVHQNSSRAKNPLIVADCTSIPETLAESLLFGHLKGSFTGAHNSTLGLFRQSDSGTLFLDEIGDLSQSIQKSLLRVLQNKRLTPVGSSKEMECDFRLVAATNRNLEELVQKGLFRKDLYYRLITSVLYLPPLRERKEDIQPLLDHYLPEACADLQLPEKTYTQEFLEALQDYNWPGNIRELINCINVACTSASTAKELRAYHLPTDLRAHLAKNRVRPQTQQKASPSQEQQLEDNLIKISPNSEGEFPTYKQARQEVIHKMEKIYLKNLLDYSQRDITGACRVSKLSRARLYELFKKHQISPKK